MSGGWRTENPHWTTLAGSDEWDRRNGRSGRREVQRTKEGLMGDIIGKEYI